MKKTVAILLCLLLVISGGILSVSAADDAPAAEAGGPVDAGNLPVEASDVEAQPGDQPAGDHSAELPAAEDEPVILKQATAQLLPGVPVLQNSGGAAAQEPVVILSFDALDAPAITVPCGTPAEALGLPDALAVNEGQVTLEGVTWACAAYDAQTPDTYSFEAVLPEGAALAGEEAPALPQIAVTVEAPVVAARSMAPMDVSSHKLEDAVTITGSTLKKDGAAVGDGDTIFSTNALKVRYDFMMTEGQLGAVFGLQPTDRKFYVPLPEGLAWPAAGEPPITINCDVEDEHGQTTTYVLGSLVIDPQGVGVYVNFEGNFWVAGVADELEQLSYAYIELGCALDMTKILGAKEYTFNFADGDSLGIKVGDNQDVAHKMEKAGRYNAASNRFEWTVTFTPGNVAAVSPAIVDTFDSEVHVFVPGSLTVAGDTTVIDESTMVSTDPGSKETTINYPIAAITPGTAIVLTYETALSDWEAQPTDDPAETVAHNKAVLWSGGAATDVMAEKSATASAADKTWMSKDGEFVAGERKIHWTVTINRLDRFLENLKLFDKMADGLELVDASIRIDGQDLSTAGATLNKSLTDPAKSGITPDFAIVFPTSGYAQTIVVEYDTLIADSFFDNADSREFKNKAWLSFGWTDYEGQGSGSPVTYTFPEIGIGTKANTQIIQKEAVEYDRATHEITWQVTVNPHEVNVLNGTVTDDLSSLGQTYVADSFDQTEGTTLSLTAPSPDVLPNSAKALTIDVGTLGPNKAVFEFKTVVDDEADFAFNTTPQKYENFVKFKGDIQPASLPLIQDLEDMAGAEIDVVSQVVSKAGGGYDYNKNEIKWNVVVNENEMPMTGVKLVDTLPAGLSYVDGSVTGVTPVSVSYESGVLTIDLGAQCDNTKVSLSFRTKVTPAEYAGNDFNTKASFDVGNGIELRRDIYGPQTASGKQAVGNKVLQKVGVLGTGADDGLILYTVGINPNGMDLTGQTIADQLPNGLALDPDSVYLKTATLNTAGVFTAGTVVYGPDSNQWSYDATENRFTMKLPAGTGRYVLQYSCVITSYSSTSLKNDIFFDGGSITSAPGASSSSVALGAGAGGGGGMKAARGTLIITKQDSLRPGIKLEGVEFELHTMNGTGDTVVMTGVTDSNGQLTFTPLSLNKDYMLVETGSKAGYSTPMAVTASVAVPLASCNIRFAQKETQQMTVTNAPRQADVTFKKVNDCNLPLSGVQFTLTGQGDNSGYSETVASAADGTVTFPAVVFGTYRLEEIQTIAYHTPCGEAYLVTVGADGAVAIAGETSGRAISDGKIVNVVQKCCLTVYRFISGTTTPLVGARYNVYDANGDIAATGTTDENGKVAFHGLAVGARYRIAEVDTGDGYDASPDQFVVLTPKTVIDPETGLEIEVADHDVDWPKSITPQDNNDPDDETGTDDTENTGGTGDTGGTDNTGGTGNTESTGNTGSTGASSATAAGPKTGDGTSMALWITLCAAAGIACALAVIQRRKKGKA